VRHIRDPAEGQKPDSEEEIEATKRKVIRLTYLVWSGLTKCLRNMVQYKQKAVEIPGVGVFGPI